MRIQWGAGVEMKACWASCLGNCTNKITREHLVSQNLFLNDEMTVEGFPWCKGKPVKIGLASLTAKILCRQHNGDLSEIDVAGGRAFDAFREARRLANIREKKPKYRWSIVRVTIDGRGFERWCLKTLINLSCNRDRARFCEHREAFRPNCTDSVWSRGVCSKGRALFRCASRNENSIGGSGRFRATDKQREN